MKSVDLTNGLDCKNQRFSDKIVSLLLNIFAVSCQGIKALPSFLSAELNFTNRFSLHKYLKSSLWPSVRMMVLVIFIVKILPYEEHIHKPERFIYAKS